MIPGTIPMGRGVQGPPAVSYIAQTTDTVARTTYTFSSQSLGTASDDRHIAVAVFKNGFSETITSLTVAGVSASEAVTTGAGTLLAIWTAPVPSGTTGDIVVTFSASVDRCVIGTWALTGLQSATPATTATGTTSANVNTVTGDVLIVAAYRSGTTTLTPTGYTERFDVAATNRFEGGDHTAVSTETPRSISAATSSVIVSAVWR